MKKSLLAILCIICCFTMYGCSRSSIVGEWKRSDSQDERFVFFKDHTGIAELDGHEYEITSWSTEGGRININIDSSYYRITPDLNYKLEENTLTISSDSSEVVYRKIANSEYEF